MNRGFPAALATATYAVVDASLAYDMLWGTPNRRNAAIEWFALCASNNVIVIAPQVFAGELDTGVRKLLHRGLLTDHEVINSYKAVDALPVHLIFDEAESREMRVLARNLAFQLHQPNVYDCLYVALAQLRGCNFWTADKRFAHVAGQMQRQPDGSMRPAVTCVRLIEA